MIVLGYRRSIENIEIYYMINIFATVLVVALLPHGSQDSTHSLGGNSGGGSSPPSPIKGDDPLD